MQRAHLLLCREPGEETFDLAESDPITEEEYWINVFPRWVEPVSSERAVRKLIQFQRPFIAIDLLQFLTSDTLPPSNRFIAEALGLAVNSPSRDERQASGFRYDVMQLLTRLETANDVSEDELAQLEWRYLPLIGSFEHERVPRALYRVLGRDTHLFVELVALVYRAEGEEPRELTPQERDLRINARRLLISLRALPGLGDSGELDGAHLTAWVDEVRRALDQQGRASAGDSLIGQMFRHSPQGADGAWPHEVIRDIIERAESKDMDRGLAIGIHNLRGVEFRALSDGGRHERVLAERYTGYAVQIRDRWPRTSAILRRVAEGFRTDASREDQESEVEEELGW